MGDFKWIPAAASAARRRQRWREPRCLTHKSCPWIRNLKGFFLRSRTCWRGRDTPNSPPLPPPCCYTLYSNKIKTTSLIALLWRLAVHISNIPLCIVNHVHVINLGFTFPSFPACFSTFKCWKSCWKTPNTSSISKTPVYWFIIGHI